MPPPGRDPSAESGDSSDLTDLSFASSSTPPQRLVQGPYPLFRNHFSNAQQAKSWLYDRDPDGCSQGRYPFEHYRIHMKNYAEHVYCSIINLQGLRECSSNSYKNFRDNKIDHRDIEATAVLIVHAWIKRHELGPIRNFDKVPVADRNLEMEDRFTMICNTLLVCKLNCEDVLKKGKLEYLVHAPDQARKTKEQNKNINKEREPVLKAGNEVLGRRPKRNARATLRRHDRATMAPPTSLPLRHFPLPNYQPTTTEASVDSNDFQRTVILPPPINPNQSWPGNGSSSGTNIKRSSRPRAIETRLIGALDPSLSSTPKTAGLQRCLEPDTQTSMDLNTPTGGGIFTPHGTQLNLNYIMQGGTGFTPTSASGFESPGTYGYPHPTAHDQPYS